jgi:glycosyltransferase involved in cell wall biosynthesis
VFSAINQFHDGTAVGDAVTGDMLEIRRALRQAGYRSEIYASHVAPGLKGIRPADSYAGDGSALLIVHHSMGFDRFEQVVGLPDRKILKYHNITPPEMLSNGHAKHYAARGRLQLAEYRKHVELGLGDSDYNRRELEDMGYRYTDVLPIFFRPGALSTESSEPSLTRELKGTFNLLFVGRIAPNKKQLDLVRLFDEYVQVHNANARLWLVGSWDGSEQYRDEILAEIAGLGLNQAISLTGRVSASQLATYYRYSNVLLCASEHEGFCVPLLEAMSFELPVVAYSAAAVPETLGSAGILLDSKEPDLWCAVIEELRHNESFRADIVAGQCRRLSEMRIENAEARLLEIVRGLGTCSPIDVARPTLQIQGPFESSYSLAGVNRSLALALDEQNHFDTSIYCTEGPGDYSPKDTDLADKPAAKWLWQKSGMLSGKPSVTIRNLYPPRVNDVNGNLNFLHFYWEDSLVRRDWIADFNRHLDAVLAPTHYVGRVLVDSGLAIPCHVLGVGVDDRFFQNGEPAAAGRGSRPFTFLNLGSGFPRKGVDVLLEAYFTEFTGSDDVQLVVKTFPNPHNDIAAQIEAWRKKTPNPPACVHIDRDLEPEEVDELYAEADCLAYPTRAEGFGLPIAEAMACRIPVIVTAYSGHMDFCSDETAFLVDYDLVPSRSHVAIAGAQWAEPKLDQLRDRMRYVFSHRHSADVNRRVEAAYRNIKQNFRWSRVASRVDDIAAKMLRKAAPRLAMVTSWDSRCGIAEYSRYLIDAVNHGRPKVEVEVLSSPEEGVWHENGIVSTVCWDQRPASDLSRLRSQVFDRGFDIVHFQFNFGFFDLHELASTIRDFKRAGKKVVITLHSTADVPDPHGTISLRTIANALRTADLLLVHSPDDEKRMASFGISENVRILPHGNPVYPSQDHSLRKEWGITLDPVVSTFGFLLPHKGILELLEAVKILLKQFPNLGLMAQCALHRDGISHAFEPVVRQRIKDLRLEECVLLSTDFVAPEEAMLLLQLSDLVVLPYTATRESSSASVRFALGSGRPVITTKNPIFTDVSGSTLQVETSRPEDLAAAIRMVLEDPSLADVLTQKAVHQADSTSWRRIAKRYAELLLDQSDDYNQDARVSHLPTRSTSITDV